jgi:hypothetical protein
LRFGGLALNVVRRLGHEAKRQEDQQWLANLLAGAQIPRHVVVSRLLAGPKKARAALAPTAPRRIISRQRSWSKLRVHHGAERFDRVRELE